MCNCNHPDECAKPTAQTDAQGTCSDEQIEKCHGNASPESGQDTKTTE